jgi:RHS repeat-associated protein
LYFLQDHLGSTTALTNSQGATVSQISYDSFGNPSAGANLTRYTYTGREFDSDTGLYYYRARWYDPKVGRFISEDPIGLAGGINEFAYVGDDSVNARDPHGQWPSQGKRVHQEMIRRVLTGRATPQELSILMAEQEDFDRGTQDEVYAYQHAMSMRGESTEDARRKANRFVRQQICMARRLAKAGRISDAMRNLGDAIHTLQDSTSPAHVNFAAAWDNSWLQTVNHLPHYITENFDPGANSVGDYQTLRAWQYFKGDLPMPADFFSDVFDTIHGPATFRGTPSPDGGSCDCN